jgi:hypothetical protein
MALAADPAPAQNSAPPSSQPANKADPADRLICRHTEVTGSHLGGKRECHTKREWDQMAHDAEDGVNNAQRTIPGSGSSPH